MPRRTKEEAEQTRQLLLETALKMFAEQGIARTSLKDIANESGLTHGALYWHFKNRGDLVAALYEECRFPIDDLFLDQLQSARQDALESLGDFLTEWCDQILNDERSGYIWRVFHQGYAYDPELHAIASSIRDEQGEWISLLAKLLKKARKQKLVSEKTVAKLDISAGAALAIVLGTTQVIAQNAGLANKKQHIRTVVNSFLHGLHA